METFCGKCGAYLDGHVCSYTKQCKNCGQWMREDDSHQTCTMTVSGSTAVVVESKPHVPACIRTGMCCERIMLNLSPRQLRDAYENWRDSKPNTVQFDQIYLIYPMLEGTCKGKMNYGGYLKYIYGPCKNLGKDGANLPQCTVHKNKPRMCSGFPFYSEEQKIRMDTAPVANPSQLRGCGYNQDKTLGITPNEMQAQCQPLTDDEK